MVGWHHRLNGHGFGWTPGVGDGQGGLVVHGVTKSWTWLSNWTELNCNITRLQQASDFSRQHLESRAFTKGFIEDPGTGHSCVHRRYLGYPPQKSLLFFLLFSLKWSHTLCFQICSCPHLRQFLYLLSSSLLLPGHFLVAIKLCLFFSSWFPPGSLAFLPSSENKGPS